MSFIYNQLKMKIFFKEYVFPDQILPRDLISPFNSAVICVLRPDMPKRYFVENTKTFKIIESILEKIPEKRTDYYIFMLKCDKGIFCQNYPPTFPISVLKCKNFSGDYDRELGFDTWMIKFSTNFITKESVLTGKKEIFYKFMEGIRDGIIKDVLTGVHGLLSLQYS